MLYSCKYRKRLMFIPGFMCRQSIPGPANIRSEMFEAEPGQFSFYDGNVYVWPADFST